VSASARTVGAEPVPGPRGQRLQVGDWTIEPLLNRISSNATTVKLEPKVMSVLVYLAARPGEVVSREALLSAIWPGVVVGDDTLTQAVIKLRKALGDVAGKAAYVETIPKRGYRLIAPVRSQTVDGTAVRANSEHPHARRTLRVPWIAAAGIAALLLAVWWLYGERAGDGALPRTPIAATDPARNSQPTITVRPFQALGDDPQAVLLARGITADLVTDLSKVLGLAVIGTAASTASDSGTPPPAASSRYLVSGSVQRLERALRLHVHLIETETGKQLWSERFDRAPSALFALQEELGPAILKILPAKVSEAELRRVAQRHTANLEAYEHFQRGQLALLARQKAENETAREMFRRAIALDAAFARAYAGLALTYAADYRNQWTADGAAALERAFELARTAHEINPDIRETYWVLAFVHLERGQHEQALRYLETAIQLYPSFADGYALMGGIKTYMGRPAEAVPLMRTAMRLNPDGGYLYFLNLGRTYLALGQLDQARINLEHALLRNPVNLETHVYMAAVHLIGGDKAAAAWEADEIRALQPGFSIRAWLQTYPLIDVTQKTKLVEALSELGF